MVRPLAALALGWLALVGCSGPGPVDIAGAPTLTGTELAACTALTADLPDSLGDGLARRELASPLPGAAAFGDPPVVVTCGAEGVAAGYQPDALLSEVDGVGWFAEQLDDRVRYSTPTRRPQVVLTLPADRQAFEVLVALASPVREHTASTTA